jgi:hypothetical protein
MSKKVTKRLYDSLKAKLEAATAAATGKTKSKGEAAAKAKANKTGKKAAAAAKRKAAAASAAAAAAGQKRGKAPSAAEANLQKNVSLLKKLGAHRTQADVLKKVSVSGSDRLVHRTAWRSDTYKPQYR